VREDQIVKIKYSEIKNIQDAIEKYKKFKELSLELRLSSKQQDVPNYSKFKNILKKNIARVMTYINFSTSQIEE
jgi:ribosomal protein L29